MRLRKKTASNSVNVTQPEKIPQLDVEANEDFYIVTKQENSQFRYVFQNENGEEVSVILEYL